MTNNQHVIENLKLQLCIKELKEERDNYALKVDE